MGNSVPKQYIFQCDGERFTVYYETEKNKNTVYICDISIKNLLGVNTHNYRDLLSIEIVPLSIFYENQIIHKIFLYNRPVNIVMKIYEKIWEIVDEIKQKKIPKFKLLYTFG